MRSPRCVRVAALRQRFIRAAPQIEHGYSVRVVQASTSFSGNARYEILRRVGAGGGGVVYEAFDRERNARVALKTLAHLDPAALFRFKKEFRALAFTHHENLAQLRELAADGDLWFLTMEFVDGVDFIAYVRPSSEDAVDDPSTISLAPANTAVPTAPDRGELDLPRLRAALTQLAIGVAALHERGILHRDLKPSNVLVRHAHAAESARLVIVDFGLATELGEDATVTQRSAVGTPAYMAPEQADHAPASPATDWYAVGVILYRALTGGLPFTGTAAEVMNAKQNREPPPPASGAPELDALCVELLRRTEAARATGADVLRRLGVNNATAVAVEGPPFIGRTDALGTLREAFVRSREGSPTLVLVEGGSGVGKTAVVRRFLDEASERQTVVLSGRCYEREAVPYKGFDTIVDALCVWLLRATESEVDAVLPRDVAVLARVFPVLQRVPSIAMAPRRAIEGAHPQQLRARAFAALRELLARLADRRPLILFVDDLQWGDADSAALLAEIAMDPSGPMMLTIVAHRSGESSVALRALRSTEAASFVTIRVEPLESGDTRRLARALMGASADDARIDRVAAESAGNPLFVGELARHGSEDLGSLRLETVLAARIATLSKNAGRLLDVLATFGGPVDLGTAARASELERADAEASADELRTANLARGSGREDRLEPYHDRVRETVAALLNAERTKELHGCIARALLAAGNADPETLLRHAHAAGFQPLAAECAETAAARAAHLLAFDRAADLYREALELSSEVTVQRRLKVALGDALSNAGRGREAARIYLDALDGGREDLELRRRAGEQYLRSGHVGEGLRVIDALLADVGLRLSPTPLHALVSALFLRAYLAIRGFGFVVRTEEDAKRSDRLRAEICKTVAEGLAVVDPIRSVPFQTRYTLAALRVGDPHRIVRALSMDACVSSSRGHATRARTEALIAQAASIASTVRTAETDAHIDAAKGSLAFFLGRFSEAHQRWERALTIYRAESVGVWWELDAFRYFGAVGLLLRGELADLRRRMPGLLRDAQERGDLFLETNLRVGDLTLLHLFDDRPQAVREAVVATMARWPKRNFHVQHWYELQSLCQADLYDGDIAGARARIEGTWKHLSRSLLFRVEFIKMRALYLRGRIAVASGDRAVAEASAAAILKGPDWSRALGHMIFGGLGDRAAFQRAVDTAREGELWVHHHVARARLGEKSEWFARHGIRAPERTIALFAPLLGEAGENPALSEGQRETASDAGAPG